MQRIRLFVDDIRNPEDLGLRGWTVARTSDDAIRILRNGSVESLSLDHDLGGEDTGYRVACWLEEHGVWPRLGVLCHSANPVGKARIQAVIDRRLRDNSASCRGVGFTGEMSDPAIVAPFTERE